MSEMHVGAIFPVSVFATLRLGIAHRASRYPGRTIPKSFLNIQITRNLLGTSTCISIITGKGGDLHVHGLARRPLCLQDANEIAHADGDRDPHSGVGHRGKYRDLWDRERDCASAPTCEIARTSCGAGRASEGRHGGDLHAFLSSTC